MRSVHPEPEDKRKFSLIVNLSRALGGLVLAAILALAFGAIVMLLWNWLMPTIFHLPLIDYWQGWGLVLLSHILFKPGWSHGRPGPGWGRRGRPSLEWKLHLETDRKPKADEPTV